MWYIPWPWETLASILDLVLGSLVHSLGCEWNEILEFLSDLSDQPSVSRALFDNKGIIDCPNWQMPIIIVIVGKLAIYIICIGERGQSCADLIFFWPSSATSIVWCIFILSSFTSSYKFRLGSNHVQFSEIWGFCRCSAHIPQLQAGQFLNFEQ